MSIDEIINLMRLCSIAQVRKVMEHMAPEELRVIQRFYETCFRQPK